MIAQPSFCKPSTKEFWTAMAVLTLLLALPPTSVATMAAVLLAPFMLLLSWLVGLVYANPGRAVVMALYCLFCAVLYVRCFIDWIASG
jgi:hypothetical protein